MKFRDHDKTKPKTVLLKDIPIGECFRFPENDDPFMRACEAGSGTDEGAVVNLATGHYDWFDLDRPVIPANIYLSED